MRIQHKVVGSEFSCLILIRIMVVDHSFHLKFFFNIFEKFSLLHCRDEKIRNKVLRVFGIWEERGIYDSKMIGELKEIVKNVGTANASENEIVLSSFQVCK